MPDKKQEQGQEKKLQFMPKEIAGSLSESEKDLLESLSSQIEACIEEEKRKRKDVSPLEEVALVSEFLGEGVYNEESKEKAKDIKERIENYLEKEIGSFIEKTFSDKKESLSDPKNVTFEKDGSIKMKYSVDKFLIDLRLTSLLFRGFSGDAGKENKLRDLIKEKNEELKRVYKQAKKNIVENDLKKNEDAIKKKKANSLKKIRNGKVKTLEEVLIKPSDLDFLQNNRGKISKELEKANQEIEDLFKNNKEKEVKGKKDIEKEIETLKKEITEINKKEQEAHKTENYKIKNKLKGTVKPDAEAEVLRREHRIRDLEKKSRMEESDFWSDEASERAGSFSQSEEAKKKKEKTSSKARSSAGEENEKYEEPESEHAKEKEEEKEGDNNENEPSEVKEKTTNQEKSENPTVSKSEKQEKVFSLFGSKVKKVFDGKLKGYFFEKMGKEGTKEWLAENNLSLGKVAEELEELKYLEENSGPLKNNEKYASRFKIYEDLFNQFKKKFPKNQEIREITLGQFIFALRKASKAFNNIEKV